MLVICARIALRVTRSSEAMSSAVDAPRLSKVTMRPRLESRSCFFSIGLEFRTPSSGNRTHEAELLQATLQRPAIHHRTAGDPADFSPRTGDSAEAQRRAICLEKQVAACLSCLTQR